MTEHTTGHTTEHATGRTGQELRVTVAVLAYRRNDELRRGLPAVLDQVYQLGSGADISCEVLVVDNDPAGSAQEVVDEFGGPAMRYVLEPTPGISYARNRALHACQDRDLLIFIDDDERPRPDWLTNLVTQWRISGAAGVGGKVESDFEVEPDAWIRAGEFFTRRSMPTGTAIDVCATNNLLLDLTQVRSLGQWFDESLGLSGGEDTLFTRGLVAAGARLTWCEEAVVVEHVPADRVTRRWVRRRSWSHGNTFVMVQLRLADGPVALTLVRFRAIGAGVLRVLGGSVRGVLGLLTGNLRHQARGWRSINRGGGMIAAALGSHYREYAHRRRVTTAPDESRPSTPTGRAARTDPSAERTAGEPGPQ